MKMRTLAGLSLSALMLGGTMVGCSQGGISSASSRSDKAAAQHAATNAERAAKALAAGDATKAIGFAEAAVAQMPQDAGYRALLGGAYLKAGRFTSAHMAYGDVLKLSPDNGKAALNLALAMIAEGQWDGARAFLDEHSSIVPASDRGLALALAGDAPSGVELLTAAARQPDADAKTRQNLALALALAGRWQEARAVVGLDLAPIEADKRIVEWAEFAQPTGAADQVAALLGVTPVKDPGQPVALALNASVPVGAMASATPAAEPAVRPEAEQRVAQAAATDIPVAAASTPSTRVVFAERREVVQSLPASATKAVNAETRLATVSPKALGNVAERPAERVRAKGNWFVQLGAYDSVAVAKDAWDKAQRRYPAFAEQAPAGMAFKSFYRLSVGGFSRSDADALCRGYRSTGGNCFVRTGAGDQMAQWVKPTRTQLASR